MPYGSFKSSGMINFLCPISVYPLFSWLSFSNIQNSSCKRSVARRVRVSLTPETVVTIHVLYQNYKACENLLLYILLLA